MSGVNFVTITNPVTGKNVTVAVKPGTQVWNAHRVDGPAHGSILRGTDEALIKDGDTSFHVDTNNRDGVLGTFQK